jgi:hypothetical protein
VRFPATSTDVEGVTGLRVGSGEELAESDSEGDADDDDPEGEPDDEPDERADVGDAGGALCSPLQAAPSSATATRATSSSLRDPMRPPAAAP